MLTFLFTDIEDSTRLWEEQPQAMTAALAYHDAMMAQTIARFQGKVFKTVGDGVYAVFEAASQALDAALTVQTLLYEASTRPTDPLMRLRVRMGLYTGNAEERASDYFGPTLNRTARLMGAGHGGQVLLSATTRAQLPADVELRDLGMHRLRDLNDPEHIYQAVSARFPLVTKPLRTLTPRPTNLPAQLTSFVGRHDTVAEMCQKLRQPNVRLLTLMGSGGIGKTRLSIQIGASLLDEYEDGVFFLPLASLRQTDAVVKLLAQVLSIVDDDETPLLDQIKSFVASRHMLLIFDNFEQILDAAPMLNELLTAAARLKILVTSRESLYIYGEVSATVPPLSVPAASASLTQMMASSAVSLFVERIQATQPDFALTESNAADVIEICRHLDGLPLALELAAARARDLSLTEMRAQIAERLELLDHGPRDLPKRQQTMRGAIEWSYDLLSRDDREAFARLAVFEGEFFAQSAQFVAGLGAMEIFVNKSLLRQTGHDSYVLLAVLHEYALERLTESGEAEITREKHAIYYVQWLDMVRRFLNTREQTEWFFKLGVEQYNIHAAFEYYVANHEFFEAGQIASVIWRFWATQSQLAEGARRIDEVLAHVDQLTPLVQARLSQGAGRLALLRHHYEASMDFQQTSLKLFRAIGGLPGEAAVLLGLGETEYVHGNHIQAENYLGESLDIFQRLHDEAGTGRCLKIMGQIVMQYEDYPKAQVLLEQSLALSRSHGSPEGVALSLYELATAYRGQKKYDEAERYYVESGDFYRQLDLTIGVAAALYNVAAVNQAQGKLAQAWTRYLEAIELFLPLDEPFYIAECLIGVSGAFLLQGKTALCIQTLSAADAILTQIEAKDEISLFAIKEYQRIDEAVRADDDAWRSAWASGQTIATEALLKQILREPWPANDSLPT